MKIEVASDLAKWKPFCRHTRSKCSKINNFFPLDHLSHLSIEDWPFLCHSIFLPGKTEALILLSESNNQRKWKWGVLQWSLFLIYYAILIYFFTWNTIISVTLFLTTEKWFGTGSKSKCQNHSLWPMFEWCSHKISPHLVDFPITNSFRLTILWSNTNDNVWWLFTAPNMNWTKFGEWMIMFSMVVK